MNTQIYLFLPKPKGDWTSFYDSKTPALAKVGKVPGMLKAYVWGDSLDLPFPNFIRCTGVSHKIGFGDAAQAAIGKAELLSKLDEVGSKTRKGFKQFTDLEVQVQRHLSGSKNSIEEDVYKSLRNAFLPAELPDHGDFSFSKNLCPATPVLAEACSSQKEYPFAAFFFRRKTGIGIGGIRFPFFVIGLTKVKVKSWELNSDLTENVSFGYEQIGWSTFHSAADTNLPTPTMSKGWNAASHSPNTWLGQVTQAISAGLSGLAGAMTAALGTTHDVVEERVTEANQ